MILGLGAHCNQPPASLGIWTVIERLSGKNQDFGVETGNRLWGALSAAKAANHCRRR